MSRDISTDFESFDGHCFHERENKRARLDHANNAPPDDEKTQPYIINDSCEHACGTCDRRFARFEHLVRHERSHDESKSFWCTECTIDFPRRDLLLRHRQKLHVVSPATWQMPSSSRASSTASDREEAANNAGIGMRDLFDSLNGGGEGIGQPRGRTSERPGYSPYDRRSPASSRASSSSSIRTMIDERLEWAHQDRMRSFGQDDPIKQSPFHEYSPFYTGLANGKALESATCGLLLCDCCPKKPKSFETEDNLRCVNHVTLLKNCPK